MNASYFKVYSLKQFSIIYRLQIHPPLASQQLSPNITKNNQRGFWLASFWGLGHSLNNNAFFTIGRTSEAQDSYLNPALHNAFHWATACQLKCALMRCDGHIKVLFLQELIFPFTPKHKGFEEMVRLGPFKVPKTSLLTLPTIEWPVATAWKCLAHSSSYSSIITAISHI